MAGTAVLCYMAKMRINRVIVRSLRALGDRDDHFSMDQQPWAAACLRGLNGSGKTTYLEVLAQLWVWFRRCMKRRSWTEPSSDLLNEATLVAAHFTGLPGPQADLWLAWGHPEALSAFITEYSPAGLFLSEGVPTWDIDLLAWWDGEYTKAELGKAEIPNIVWIEAENKWMPELRDEELTRPGEAPPFAAVPRYLPQARGPSHLEGILLTLKVAEEERFKALQLWIAELLPGLALLSDFDTKTRRPLFRLNHSDTLLTADRLSAGERSVLINLTMVLRWLGPGGIVLLDEPELHQHLSLMAGSVAVLEEAVTRTGGQLIVASHAPEVWNHFRGRGAIIELVARGPQR